MRGFAAMFPPGTNVPDFANGYLISWTQGRSTGGSANVVLRNRDGSVERSGRIWLEGSESMDLAHATATEAGQIVAGGYGLIEPGTAWSLGRDLGKDETGEEYGILRQYSFTAGQVRELLRRRSFGTGQSPVRGRMSAFLRCTKDRVVVYTNLTHEYFEILDTGDTVRRFQVDPPQFGRRRVDFLALLIDGSVFSTIGGRGDEPRRVYELQKDEAQLTASWVPVPGAGQSPAEGFVNPPYGILFGADGDNLVLSSKQGLAWVKPQPRQQ